MRLRLLAVACGLTDALACAQVDRYQMPTAYDTEGNVDQSKRFDGLLARYQEEEVEELTEFQVRRREPLPLPSAAARRRALMWSCRRPPPCLDVALPPLLRRTLDVPPPSAAP